MLNICVIAPNSFKNGPGSIAVASAIANGVKKGRPDLTVKTFPLSDGGNGFVETVHYYNPRLKKFSEMVKGPLGFPVLAEYLFDSHKKEAFIELAQASGVHLLSEGQLNPLKTGTYGLGQVIAKVLDLCPKKIIIGLGGSATVDGGLGALSALGIRFYDEKGGIVYPEGSALGHITDIDIGGLDKRINDCELILASDVKNKLLGPRGAARAFGPQKGASPNEVAMLEDGMQHFRQVVCQKFGTDMDDYVGGGAAGGVGASLQTFLNAKVVAGADYILEYSDLLNLIGQVGILITAEGKLDEQTFEGKAPYTIANLAKQNGILTVGLAGKIGQGFHQANEKYKAFDIFKEIASADYPNLQAAIQHTLYDLEFTSAKFIDSWLSPSDNNS